MNQLQDRYYNRLVVLQGTRIRKRKVAMANRKKREERLRKNPPPLPHKVILMLKAKRLLGPWRKLRPGGIQILTPNFDHASQNLRQTLTEKAFSCR